MNDKPNDWTLLFSYYMNASLIVLPVDGGWRALLDQEPMALTDRCAVALEALVVAMARGDDPSAVWVRAADVASVAAIAAGAYERAQKG